MAIEKRKCGHNVLKRLFEKHTTKRKSIPSTFIVRKGLPKNPYCSSITGTYAFNLSKISSFKVYFWKSTDTNVNIKNEAIKNILLENNSTPVNWPPFYQTQTLNALNQFSTFVNKTSSIVSTYETCNIVCVLGSFNFLGGCYGAKYLYENSSYVDKRIIIFIDNENTNINNIKKGGQMYLTLVHEFGHGFGLDHPHDTVDGSKIIPGINPGSDMYYPSFSAYGQNNVFNTVMSYYDTSFFLPENRDFDSALRGYPETLMPLDLLAIRWLYNLSGTSISYLISYGVSTINPTLTESKSQTIVGENRTITFGVNCKNVSFYFSNQLITTSNIEPIVYEYNRVLEKGWGFYPKDVASTVSVLNFSNTNVSNIFIEKSALKINLTINLVNNKVFNMYIRDFMSNYTIIGNKYTMKANKLFIQINNTAKATINVFFT
jgi:hypothetical protein